jgi:D-3-phosphoglycerate dehydrogenase / 2-oxoglutarate reductase
MDILILEPENYSAKAILLYSSIGSVALGGRGNANVDNVGMLIVRLNYMLDEGFLRRYPSLKFIVSPTTGLTHIDLKYCSRKGITIYSLNNLRGMLDDITSTSELCIGLIISLVRCIPTANEDVILHGRWERDKFRSRQLSKLTLGVVGLGRIGRQVAHVAKSFGMTVIASDPYLSKDEFEMFNIERCSLESLLARSDIVSVHANLSDSNRGMFGARELALMKPGAFLINTARGELVDECAAVDALKEKRLGGIAIDVVADEPLKDACQNSPLIRGAIDGLNIIVTPHIGGCTSDAMGITEDRLAEFVIAELNT